MEVPNESVITARDINKDPFSFFECSPVGAYCIHPKCLRENNAFFGNFCTSSLENFKYHFSKYHGIVGKEIQIPRHMQVEARVWHILYQIHQYTNSYFFVRYVNMSIIKKRTSTKSIVQLEQSSSQHVQGLLKRRRSFICGVDVFVQFITFVMMIKIGTMIWLHQDHRPLMERHPDLLPVALNLFQQMVGRLHQFRLGGGNNKKSLVFSHLPWK